MSKNKDKFFSFGEYLLAIKNASEGKGIDKRLIRKKIVSIITDKELGKIEIWADELIAKRGGDEKENLANY